MTKEERVLTRQLKQARLETQEDADIKSRMRAEIAKFEAQAKVFHALALGLWAERAELDSRIQRIDLRLKALGYLDETSRK